jgi:hypothetical protein
MLQTQTGTPPEPANRTSQVWNSRKHSEGVRSAIGAIGHCGGHDLVTESGNQLVGPVKMSPKFVHQTRFNR